MIIKKGSSLTTTRLAGSSCALSFTPVVTSNVTWGGDLGYVKLQEGTIDDTTSGTVGRIHLLERVYDSSESTAINFCVTAGDGSGQGIKEVRIYYGSATPTQVFSLGFTL